MVFNTLSGRFLGLMVVFVLIAEVLIFVPSVARFRADYLQNRLEMAQLAALVDYSPFHFARAFKRSFGMPPHRYHVTRRLERAKTLLTAPDASVTSVALAVGFAETSSFSAAFRKGTGFAPSDYRRGLG